MKNEDNDSVIDLRGEDGFNFKMSKVDGDFTFPVEEVVTRSSEIVKVKFEKFVSLVANHDYDDVVERHQGEEIYMKADLLTELADVPVEKVEKKFPSLFVVGIAVGVAIAWILFKM